MIKIQNLTKSFGKTLAVNNLSLEIKDNSIFALLGLNGAGKSTTINILSTLIPKTSGKVFINNFDLDKDTNNIKKILSVAPQETAVAKNLSVKENLTLIAELYDVPNKQNAVEKIIKEFELTEKENVKAKNLSGGQKRRLSLAMALITNPQILILDEPTLALDVVARKKLWSIIEGLKNKMTIILTTHYLEEAESLCDEIAIMKNGALVGVGSVEEIIKSGNFSSFENAFIELTGGENE